MHTHQCAIPWFGAHCLPVSTFISMIPRRADDHSSTQICGQTASNASLPGLEILIPDGEDLETQPCYRQRQNAPTSWTIGQGITIGSSGQVDRTGNAKASIDQMGAKFSDTKRCVCAKYPGSKYMLLELVLCAGMYSLVCFVHY
jgi:hypothetical protein